MPARSHTPAGGWSAARVVPYRPCQSSPSPRCPTVGAGSSRFLAKIPPPPPPKKRFPSPVHAHRPLLPREGTPFAAYGQKMSRRIACLTSERARSPQCQSSPSPRCPTVGSGSSRSLAKIPPPTNKKTIPANPFPAHQPQKRFSPIGRNMRFALAF